MSSVSSTEIGRLVRLQIQPPSADGDVYTLIFETTVGDWACVADHELLQMLAATIQKHDESQP